MNIGFIHGVPAPILAALGGGLMLIYLSIKRTKGPRERRFLIWGSIAVFTGIFLLVGLDCYLLHGGWAVKTILGVVAFWSFLSLKQKQREIRRAEATNA